MRRVVALLWLFLTVTAIAVSLAGLEVVHSISGRGPAPTWPARFAIVLCVIAMTFLAARLHRRPAIAAPRVRVTGVLLFFASVIFAAGAVAALMVHPAIWR